MSAEASYKEIKFTDADVVDLDDWIPDGEYNPHRVRPWLLHDHGFVLAVVFADCLQDALDAAVDADKLDRYLIAEEDYEEYGVMGDNPTCCFLGNAGEPFDIESLEVVELPNPRRATFCESFNLSFNNGR
jgi:hypothetical protein